MDAVNAPAKFEVRRFTRSGDNRDWSFSRGYEPPIQGMWVL